MKTVLASVDLVVECRDCRVPLTSRNPAFENSLRDKHLGGRQRLIVYTKSDLVRRPQMWEGVLAQKQAPVPVMFTGVSNQASVRAVLTYMQNHLQSIDSLTGSRMMIVGMPNVGKSSLLNVLRRLGLDKGKAARTGSQPGITRKVGSGVKVLDDSEDSGGVYLIDTPGVFVPYMEDSEAMLKLALCGSVKDSIIGSIILADYLLFRLNLVSPKLYQAYSAPTNEVEELLRGVAQKTGRLRRGGLEDLEGAAMWLIHQWRGGKLGAFCLDDVSDIDSEELSAGRKSKPEPQSDVIGDRAHYGRHQESNHPI